MEKQQFKLEYSFKSSAKVLFNRLSTPSGLSEWFADDVNVENNYNTFIFMWDGYPSKAEVVSKKDGSFIKFHWEEDEDDDVYFEFRILVDDLTGDLALIITDYAEEDEIEDSIQLWNSQIDQLKQIIGS